MCCNTLFWCHPRLHSIRKVACTSRATQGKRIGKTNSSREVGVEIIQICRSYDLSVSRIRVRVPLFYFSFYCPLKCGHMGWDAAELAGTVLHTGLLSSSIHRLSGGGAVGLNIVWVLMLYRPHPRPSNLRDRGCVGRFSRTCAVEIDEKPMGKRSLPDLQVRRVVPLGRDNHPCHRCE